MWKKENGLVTSMSAFTTSSSVFHKVLIFFGHHNSELFVNLVNPFPNKLWLLRVCSTSLLQTLWEKEKLLVKSNFFFSHSVFYPFDIFIKFEIVICKVFYWKSLKFVVWERIISVSNHIHVLYIFHRSYPQGSLERFFLCDEGSLAAHEEKQLWKVDFFSCQSNKQNCHLLNKLIHTYYRCLIYMYMQTMLCPRPNC